LEVLRFHYLLPLGLVAFTFCQAALLGRRYAVAQLTAQDLSEQLEIKVAERTVDLAVKNAELERAVVQLRKTQGQLRQVGLPLARGAEYRVFPYSEILYVSGGTGTSVLHLRSGDQEIACPLEEIESLLAEQDFMRVDPDHVVNLGQVANVAPVGSGGYIVVLRDAAMTTLRVNGSQADSLKQRLGIAD
jgi:DNA-binding LytR/AlgR family response regulator